MAKECVTFKLDLLPVSENKAIRMNKRGGYKTQDYKEWEEYVLLTLKEQEICNSQWYETEIIFTYPIYYKNGNVRRKDAHNMIKYAIDTILHNKVVDEDGEKIDDCRIIGGSWTKCEGDEGVEISFYCVG
jgi:Holliday junction resolvase RusA-like endonuclease